MVVGNGFVMDKYPEICYLCGNPLSGEINGDHVPPKQLFPKTLRIRCNMQLFELPTHKKCNNEYSLDEAYFMNTLVPLAMDSKAGIELVKDVKQQKGREGKEGERLISKIYGEFEPRPSGLYLSGKVIKSYDGVRVRRVIWKITRGLYFKENKEYLHKDVFHRIEIIYKGEPLPDEFSFVRDTPSLGDYPEVFDYKKVKLDELEILSMLLWERFIFIVYFSSDINYTPPVPSDTHPHQ